MTYFISIYWKVVNFKEQIYKRKSAFKRDIDSAQILLDSTESLITLFVSATISHTLVEHSLILSFFSFLIKQRRTGDEFDDVGKEENVALVRRPRSREKRLSLK